MVVDYEEMELCDMEDIIFDEEYITTKAELLEALKHYVKQAKSKKGLDIFKERSSGFKKVYLKVLDEFYERVLHTQLFEHLEPWWFYSFSIDEKEAVLHLQHVNHLSVSEIDGVGYVDSIFTDEDFELVTKEIKMLSVEQYAEIYGVSVGTVRQWIRRAKIRGAVKTAKGWRISELCEVRERKYTKGSYYFDEGEVTSEEYPFLNKSTNVTIKQDLECAELFRVTYWGDHDEDDDELEMNRQEREKFELFLISHPNVRTGRKVFVDVSENGVIY